MKMFFCILALSFASPDLLADSADAELNSTLEAAVGLSVGWVEANGLSYRRYFGNQYIQGTFAAAIDRDNDSEYVDMSISYSRYLNVFEMKNQFFPIGMKIVAGSEIERNTDRPAEWFNSKANISPDALHVGLGVGADLGNPLREGFVVSLNALYTATFRGFKALEFVRLGLLPSVSVHYNY